MIDINELRRLTVDCYWPTSPVSINEILDRLEAAEEDRSNFIVEMGRLCAQCDALRAKIGAMEKQEPVAWLHETRRDSDVVTDSVKHVWGKAVVGSLAAYSIPLYLAPGAQPAQKAVAYLDLGAGGYMDIGTDLNDEQLASLPKGRHMLGIVGTYGVDGYVSAQQCKNCNGMGDRFDPSGEKIPCDLCESNLEEIRVLVAEAAHDIISGSDFWLSTSLAAKKIYALPGAKGEEK